MVEGSDIYFAETPVAPARPAVAGRRTSKRQRAGDADESCYTLQTRWPSPAPGGRRAFHLRRQGGGLDQHGKLPLLPKPPLTCTVGSNLTWRSQRSYGTSGSGPTGIWSGKFPCDILGPLAYEHDLLPTYRVSGCAVRVPSGPGLVLSSMKECSRVFGADGSYEPADCPRLRSHGCICVLGLLHKQADRSHCRPRQIQHSAVRVVGAVCGVFPVSLVIAWLQCLSKLAVTHAQSETREWRLQPRPRSESLWPKL